MSVCFHLYLVISAKTLLPKRSYPKVLNECEFWGDTKPLIPSDTPSILYAHLLIDYVITLEYINQDRDIFLLLSSLSLSPVPATGPATE